MSFYNISSEEEEEEEEEERLVQMVHDFIESDSSPSPIFSNPILPPINHSTVHLNLLKEILRGQSAAETEVLDIVLKLMMMRSKMEAAAERTTTPQKWLALRLKLDGYNASLCQTSWVTSLGCPAGCYEYIDVILRDANGSDGSVRRLIVDIDFKSQFELARPTPTYKQLSGTLPSIFVGEEQKLRRIISLLCSAAKDSLKERGLHIPPWRTRAYMQCKWLSNDSHRDVPNNSASRENGEKPKGKAVFVPSKFDKWGAGAVVKPKRRDLDGGGSGLSSQFSNMSINCC